MKTADKEKRSVIPEKRQRKAKSKKSLVANSYNSRLPLMNEPIGMTDHLRERKQHLSVTKYLPERMQADTKCHFLMSLRYFPTEHAFQNAIVIERACNTIAFLQKLYFTPAAMT